MRQSGGVLCPTLQCVRGVTKPFPCGLLTENTHSPPSGGGCDRIELYAVAKTFEALFQTTRDVLTLPLIEIGFAEVLEWMLVQKQVVYDAQDAVAVCHGD